MIKKLRIKFIAAAMLSLFSVLAIIIGAVNFMNYRAITEEADSILTLLKENGGNFPIRNDKPVMNIPAKDMPDITRRHISPELPYESRFFSVILSSDGKTVFTDIENIAAVDRTSASELAEKVFLRKNSSGFEGSYRYTVGTHEDGTQIIFLDCTRSLSTFRSFLFLSCGISLAGLAAFFILIVLLSGRIIKPISESYEKQKRFITDAGHEIKTPITIIDADAEVLEMELGDNEWLSDIHRQAKRLGTLTNDLIYLSRMQEEKINLQTIDFPLSDIVYETAQSFQAPAKTQNKSFTIDIEPMLTLNGDEKAIRQLVSILLDNALKYSTESGNIKLSLKRQGKAALLSVSNTAENISQDTINHLFERFYRADKSRSSETGGYGIGLSVAKAVTDAHKGKISAHCRDGASLTITVLLPIQ